MSVNELFSPNDLSIYVGDLHAKSQTIDDSLIVDGDLTVTGNEILNGALTMKTSQPIYLGAGDTIPNNFWGIYKNTGSNQNLVIFQNGTVVDQSISIQTGNGFLECGKIACGSISFVFNDIANFKLNYYEFRNIPISFAGPWAAPIPSLLHITRVGNMVTMMIDGVSGVITGPSTITGVPVIPSSLLPTSVISQVMPIINGGTNSVTGAFQMQKYGNITISDNFANFAGIGNTGFFTFSVSYSIA